MTIKNSLRSGVAAAAILLAAAAAAAPAFSPTPVLIPVPPDFANSQGGKLTSFDISTFDPATNLFYLGDRSNAAIDVFNLNNNTFVGQIGAGQFTGQKSSNASSGADGTAVFTTTGPNPVKLVLGGDGNSTVKAYAVTGNPATIAGYSANPLYTVNTGLPGVPANYPPGVTTGPVNNRADEMAYDPVHNNLLVSNNAASPAPFTTLFNASNGAIINQTVFDGTHGTPDATGNSIEASIYDPAKDVFWLAIPQIGPSDTDPGGLSEVNAATGAVIATFPFSVATGSCNPTGVALSGNNQVAIGCANKGSQTLIFDTDTHAFKSVAYSGSDAVVFDPAINAFLVSGANYLVGGVVTPSFAIIDADTDMISQILATSPGNNHSIDGGNAVIGVPFVAGANSLCVNGCLAVYSEVPEPATLPLFLTATVALVGFGIRRHGRLS